MSELEKNSDTFVLFNSHYQVYLAIGTGTLMIEANVVHTTPSPETARTFSIYAQAREFMNLLNEYHDKEFEAWGVINGEYIDFFCKVAEPKPQLTIPKSMADLSEYQKLKADNEIMKKALTEIQQLKRRDTTNLGMINKLQTIANEALEAIGYK